MNRSGRFKKSKKKKSKAVILYLAIIVVMSLLAVGYKTLNTHLQDKLSRFELNDIHIKGNAILEKGEILKLLGLNKGEKLLEISPAQVAQTLKESVYVRSVNAVYSLPSTLRIRLNERQPVAFIYGRGLNLVDREGFILPVPLKNIHWNLPVITGIDENLGRRGAKTTSEKAQLAVDIARYVHMLEMPLKEMVSEINFSNADFVAIGLSGSKAVIRVDKKNYQEQLFIAARYLKDYLDYENLENLRYVDVRFDKQIIIKEIKV